MTRQQLWLALFFVALALVGVAGWIVGAVWRAPAGTKRLVLGIVRSTAARLRAMWRSAVELGSRLGLRLRASSVEPRRRSPVP
ncbi:MAG: hypothetical protein OEV72_06570 [Thermoleophilia bacterium]|nr:hypothetical protein [Thermoleophilia bacterium]MDH5333782.1 hypothetical protein [Thermoleophilia bacterium]